MTLQIPYDKRKKINEIVSYKKSKIINFIDFKVLSLFFNESYVEKITDEEAVIVMLEGKCIVKCDGNIYKLSRKSVFDEPADALFISKNIEYKVISCKRGERSMIAICKCKDKAEAERKMNNKIIHIHKEQVEIVHRGKNGFKRDVHNIVEKNIDANRILVGETFTPAGNWSSYPPHKHDKDSADEVKLEEIYFFKVRPADGFGLIRLYSYEKKFDKTFCISNNDTVIIPFGFHPVSAAPGYDLYYLWILAGKKRIMKLKEDIKHSWINKE